MSAQRSIVICGGAFAGLALALALRQGLGADIPVIVADPALGVRPSRDPRATAIVAACRRLFEALGVWGQVADGAQPILDMVVTDSSLEDATRPVFLTFAGDVEPGEPFAHMVENLSSTPACWLPPTAPGRNCASAQGSLPTAGSTIKPASWSPSATSAIIRAAPKSIFCPQVRSRSCR